MGEHPSFRQDFSRYEAPYQAIRAYSLAVLPRVQDVLASGEGLSAELGQRMRQSATYAHHG